MLSRHWATYSTRNAVDHQKQEPAASGTALLLHLPGGRECLPEALLASYLPQATILQVEDRVSSEWVCGGGLVVRGAMARQQNSYNVFICQSQGVSE